MELTDFIDYAKGVSKSPLTRSRVKKIQEEELKTPQKSNFITRAQLLSGEVCGVYQVEDPLVGYKKIICKTEKEEADAIAKLEIPKNAFVVRAMDISAQKPSNKLRTSKAIVKYIEYPPGFGPTTSKCYSYHDPLYRYTLGKECVPEKTFDFTTDTTIASGIHFYVKKNETCLL